jgi:predicted nucleotidyltransferase
MVAAETEIQRIVKEYIAKLAPEIRVRKVILFGSYAHGSPHEWSDIDIAVISEDLDQLDPVRRVELMAVKKLGCDSRLGVLGYGLKEYEDADHLTFLGEIKRTGKVIWEAQDGSGQG